MIDNSQMKLGKKAPVYSRKTPRLVNYASDLPTPPASVDYSTKLQDLGVMMNDFLGDCTAAAVGHAIQTWTSQTRSTQVVLPDSDILSLYEKSCGYVPGNPSTDQGGDENTVLQYWRDSGIFPGNTLAGWCSVQPGNHTEVKQAIYLFGVLYIGVDLPLTAQNQSIWDVVTTTGQGEPGSWGGHAVPVIGYDDTYLTFISWGQGMKMTWAFWDAYTDEAHALLSADWIEDGQTPSGQYWTHLKSDLLKLR